MPQFCAQRNAFKAGARAPSAPARRAQLVAPVAAWAASEHKLPALGLGLAAAAAALQLVAMPASAAWDGESSAIGSCALNDAGDECRKRVLSNDRLGSYSGMADNQAKIGGKATGVPVSDLGSQYAQDTASLGDTMVKYAQLDPSDPARPQLVKRIKAEGQAWVSKYARGGSARKLSARRVYIAVDALQGHLASNGFAPYPASKVAKLVSDVEQGKALIAEGK